MNITPIRNFNPSFKSASFVQEPKTKVHRAFESGDRNTIYDYGTELFDSTHKLKMEAMAKRKAYHNIAKNGWHNSDYPSGKPYIRCISPDNKSGQINKFDENGNLIETFNLTDRGNYTMSNITSFYKNSDEVDQFVFFDTYLKTMNIGKSKNKCYYSMRFDTIYPHSPGMYLTSIFRVPKGSNSAPDELYDIKYTYTGYGCLNSAQIMQGVKKNMFGVAKPVYKTIKFS